MPSKRSKRQKLLLRILRVRRRRLLPLLNNNLIWVKFKMALTIQMARKLQLLALLNSLYKDVFQERMLKFKPLKQTLSTIQLDRSS